MATITPIPPLLRTSLTYKTDLETFFSTRIPTLTTELLAYISTLGAISMGGALAIPYVFSAATSAGDPGNGKLSMNATTPAATTAIYLDLLGGDTRDYTAVLDGMATSSSAILGSLRIVKLSDPTQFACFNVTGYTVQSGYRQMTVTPTSSSGSTPFSATDALCFYFQRSGDKGSVGPAGSLIRRATTFAATTATLTVDTNTTDIAIINGLSQALTVGAPTTSGAAAADGQGLMIRITDNATTRAIAWNAIFRPSTDMALPTATVAGKTLYLGFIYNAAAVKWDYVSSIGNF